MIYLRVFDIVILLFGEMSEWSKVHDWKSCKVKSLPGFESPSLRLGQILRCWRHPTPPGPGGSNGKWLVGETQAICPIFYTKTRAVTESTRVSCDSLIFWNLL